MKGRRKRKFYYKSALFLSPNLSVLFALQFLPFVPHARHVPVVYPPSTRLSPAEGRRAERRRVEGLGNDGGKVTRRAEKTGDLGLSLVILALFTARQLLSSFGVLLPFLFSSPSITERSE